MPQQLNFNGELIGCGVLICESKAIALYNTGGFGTLTPENCLLLNSYESVLLIERGRLDVDKPISFSSNEIISFFCSEISNFWTKYLVYKDLKDRGLKVSLSTVKGCEGFQFKNRSKSGGSFQQTIVYSVIESIPIPIPQIERQVQLLKKIQFSLIYAVLDVNGEITYYQVKDVNFANVDIERHLP